VNLISDRVALLLPLIPEQLERARRSCLSLIVRRFQMASTYFLNVFSLKKSAYLQFCFIVAYVNEKYRRNFCKNFRCKQCRLEVQYAKWWKYLELMLSAGHWNVRKRVFFSGKKNRLNWVEECKPSIRDMGSTKFSTQYIKIFFVALRSESRVRQNRRPRAPIRDKLRLLRSFNSDMINQVIISRKPSKE
jgi:hypothetical protein